MKDIYLLINGDQTGPFTEELTRQSLSEGLIPHDLPAWQEGMADWVPVSTVLGNGPWPLPLPLQLNGLLPFSKHAIATLTLSICGLLLFPLAGFWGFIPAGIESYVAKRSIRKHGFRGKRMLTLSLAIFVTVVGRTIIESVLLATSK